MEHVQKCSIKVLVQLEWFLFLKNTSIILLSFNHVDLILISLIYLLIYLQCSLRLLVNRKDRFIHLFLVLGIAIDELLWISFFLNHFHLWQQSLEFQCYKILQQSLWSLNLCFQIVKNYKVSIQNNNYIQIFDQLTILYSLIFYSNLISKIIFLSINIFYLIRIKIF